MSERPVEVSAAEQAIRSVLNSRQAYCKFLSANDTGATGGHQCGILVSKSAHAMLFSQPLDSEPILKRTVEISWPSDLCTRSRFTYYNSKNELRITTFGRDFPFLAPDQTGVLFVMTRQDDDAYRAFFLETEEEIERFLCAFGLGPTETNRLINVESALPQVKERHAIQAFIQSLTEDFPQSSEMSAAARAIQDQAYDHVEYIRTNPDRKLLDWTNTEYALFRALEHAHYGDAIAHGFPSVDAFVQLANEVLNRRKSRAGKSLEHHLAALFDGNHLRYAAQAKTEGNKKPDFLFPSQAAYGDLTFPTEKLITLAAKTTCKDRWRQILNEADRLRDKTKYLCTLQQGISPTQMDEMQAENVVLVVPKPYIAAYPKDRQERIWPLAKFIAFVQETEGAIK